MNRFRNQMYLGSPKNKVEKRELFQSNNADTPSNKQEAFGQKKNLYKKKKSNSHAKHFVNLINVKSGKKYKKSKYKVPHSTKNISRKINFYQDNLNFSRAERQSGLIESRKSENQYSIQGGSAKSKAYNVYSSKKKSNLILSKGKKAKSIIGI